MSRTARARNTGSPASVSSRPNAMSSTDRAGTTRAASETAILLVEDDAMVQEWVRLALKGSDYRFAGQAAEAAGALTLAERRDARLLLVDYRLPGRSGADLVRELRARGVTTPVLLMTANPTAGFNELAREAGAQGTIVKTGDPGELHTALRALVNGQTAFDPRHPRRRPDRPPLSPREREIMRLIAGGATNRDIARALNVGGETVKTLCARAFAKLGAHKRAEAVAAAQTRDLL